MNISTWLRELGLERYERAFRDNEVDADLLPNLTADDLKDLGVTLVGHRRRLLDAIAALEASQDTAGAEPLRAAPSWSSPPVRERGHGSVSVPQSPSGRLPTQTRSATFPRLLAVLSAYVYL